MDHFSRFLRCCRIKFKRDKPVSPSMATPVHAFALAAEERPVSIENKGFLIKPG
jgi:hypothetical protein